MKRIFTFLFFLLNISFLSAQLDRDDIVFWLGDGDQEAYFLVDFRDGSEDASFGWGVRYNLGDGLVMQDVFDKIAQTDSGFISRVTGGFLNDVIYNHHAGIDSEPDWWSTWSGNSVDAMGMQGGISEQLQNGRWYGLSYGFMPVPVAPTFKYAAYNPNWFTQDDVEYWIGNGTKKIAVVIDFVTDDLEEEVTFAWGIKYNSTINIKQALELLAAQDDDLEVNFDNNDNLESIQYKNLVGEIDSLNKWKTFAGHTMSDYRPVGWTINLSDYSMIGVSFGDDNVRRPYLPVAVKAPEEPEEPVEPEIDNLDKDDIVFWIGEGSQEAYFLIDFRDGSEDVSFGWGIKFEENETIDMLDALHKIERAEQDFIIRETNGFLNDVIYNHHEGLDGNPDWWSTWSGNSVDAMGSQGGLNEVLQDGKWYGLSYGFMPEPVAPTFKYAAYDAEWFTSSDVKYWIGNGTNEVIVTIDFVDNVENDLTTFAWGINFDDSITGIEALEKLSEVDEDLEIILNSEDELISVKYKEMIAIADEEKDWRAFYGENMSSYRPFEFTEQLMDNSMFGIAFGTQSVRRPYVPFAVEDPTLGISNNEENIYKIWPNPASDILYIDSELVLDECIIYNMMGKMVQKSKKNVIPVNSLSSGVYILEIISDSNVVRKRFVKR